MNLIEYGSSFVEVILRFFFSFLLNTFYLLNLDLVVSSRNTNDVVLVTIFFFEFWKLVISNPIAIVDYKFELDCRNVLILWLKDVDLSAPDIGFWVLRKLAQFGIPLVEFTGHGYFACLFPVNLEVVKE